MKAGDAFTFGIFEKLLEEEHGKLLQASNRDVHDDSKGTTLPIVKEIVRTYAAEQIKVPWYIDLLNINLNNHDLEVARKRTATYMSSFKKDGTRITENLDFVPVTNADQARN